MQPLEERVRSLVEAGDASAAATLAIEEFGPGVLRYLRSVLRDEEDAADAFSDFAERLWKGLPELRSASSLKTWSFRIAWHSALNLRNEAWRRRGRRMQTGEASAIAETIRTRTAVRVERQRTALDELRRELTSEEQTLLTLRLDHGLSWVEVAKVLGDTGHEVSAPTLMKRFERLKVRLADMARERKLI